MKSTKLIVLSGLLLFSVNMAQVKAQNSERKINHKWEKVQKAARAKALSKQKKSVKSSSNKKTSR